MVVESEELEDWSVLDDVDINLYIPLDLYKIGSTPNSKLLTYNIRVDRCVINHTLRWVYRNKATLNCVIYNLISCLNKNTKLVYSRHKDDRCTNKKNITTRKVIKAVDWLEKEGYITNHIGKPAKNVEDRMSSYIEPTDRFRMIWEEKQRLKAELDYLEQMEGIELRDKDKSKIDFRSNEAITNMSGVVRKLNKVNEKSIVVDGNGDRITNIYCRIFNETFNYGGRFYRADILSIQNKETDYRLDVSIDGERVCEVDFSNLHFRIASALEEMDIEDLPLDVYSGMLEDESNKIDRSIVKLAVNIMFNCKDEVTARKTIQDEINKLKPESKDKYTLGNAKSVMSLIYEAYPNFTDLFCSADSFGRILQNHDSNLASDILDIFIEKEIPCLPVHDSFIVQFKHMDLLCDTMGDCFRKRFNVTYPVPVGVKWRENGVVIERKLSV